jgi:uncharacterized protein
MTLRSSLYVGKVMHRRLSPRKHEFRYRAFWFLLDLDEIGELAKKLVWFSHNRSNVFSFYDTDHGDGTETPLRTQIERLLAGAKVELAGGRICLLCMPRTLGYCFNPISIFFCYRADTSLAAMIYQVHNTFRERHSYVIRVENETSALRQRCRKLFYVSPFLDMDMRYDFRVTRPGERIVVGVCASSSRRPLLQAVLTGMRKDLTNRNLTSVFLKMPTITIKVIGAIHWEALRLWAKGIGLRRRPSPPKQAATIVAMTPANSD